MKTRKILAASTAALLAFGTTAIVASATEDDVKLTITLSATEVADTAEQSDVLALVTGVSATKVDSTGEDKPLTIKENEDYTVKAELAKDGKTWTVTVEAKTGGALDEANIVSGDTKTVTVTESKVTVTAATVTIPDKAVSKTALEKAITVKDSDGKAVDTTLYTVTITDGTDKKSWDVAVVAKDTKTLTLTGGTKNVKLDSSSSSTPASTKLSKVDSEKGTAIGENVKVKLTDDDIDKIDEKYENFNIVAHWESVAGDVDGDKTYVRTTDGDNGKANSTVSGLDKALKKEIAKIETKNFAIVDINLADGDVVKEKSPVPITITIETTIDAKVYHVSGKTVEKLNISKDKLVDDTYRISFETKSFSPFILTTADLKNANATTKDNEPTSAAATTSDGATSTNPDTGIALAIAPVVLAAGAVAVVALKKKH